jgi:hypothetical protein
MEEITIEHEIEIILTKSADAFDGISSEELFILSVPENDTIIFIKDF